MPNEKGGKALLQCEQSGESTNDYPKHSSNAVAKEPAAIVAKPCQTPACTAPQAKAPTGDDGNMEETDRAPRASAWLRPHNQARSAVPENPCHRPRCRLPANEKIPKMKTSAIQPWAVRRYEISRKSLISQTKYCTE